jgi:hypothetical protein
MITPDLVDLHAHTMLRKCARLIDAGLYDWIVTVEPTEFRSDEGTGDTCHGTADYFHRKITLDAAYCAQGIVHTWELVTHEIAHALCGAASNSHNDHFESTLAMVRKITGSKSSDWDA